MLAVAVVGMLVYSAAGAAPDDGKDLGPAKPSTTTTSKCEPSTPSTGKGDDKEPTTSTTGKDGDKESTTSTTRKDDDKESTTSTTEKDGDDKDADPRAAKAAAPSRELSLQGAAVATAAKDGDAADDDD
ncbi:MAG TPA: hypothetical protein VEG38_21555, partial [Acidimicrobiia bacterium]|nr:hypothetical protein [Acidimicrobiia bacterium]